MSRHQPPAGDDAPPAYKVEIDDSEVCAHCGRGALWLVVGPDGAAMGRSFYDKGDAEDLASEMSFAYEKGRQAALRGGES